MISFILHFVVQYHGLFTQLQNIYFTTILDFGNKYYQYAIQSSIFRQVLVCRFIHINKKYYNENNSDV